MYCKEECKRRVQEEIDTVKQKKPDLQSWIATKKQWKVAAYATGVSNRQVIEESRLNLSLFEEEQPKFVGIRVIAHPIHIGINKH